VSFVEMCRSISAHSSDPLFGLGLLAHLRPPSMDSWAHSIDLAGARGDSWMAQLTELTVEAYSTGAVPAQLATRLYNYMGTGQNENGSQIADAPLMADLANNTEAATFFVRDLSPGEISKWSQNDQGLFTTARCSYGTPHEAFSVQCMQQMALSVVGGNLMGYADYPEYAGPLSVGQLGAIMYAAERDHHGEEVSTNLIGPWFLQFGGEPDGSNALSVVAWVSPLVSLNGAVASPTGAFIQNATDWLNGGWVLAETLLTSGVGELLSPVIDAMTGWMVGDQVFSAVQEAGFADALAESGSFTQAYLSSTLEAAETAERDQKLVAIGYDIYDHTKDLLEAKDNFTSLVSGNTGVDKEVRYYFAIMYNTFHEATARLVQQGVLLGPGAEGGVVTTSTSSGISAITASPKGYTLKGGVPLTVVWATIWAQFTATH